MGDARHFIPCRLGEPSVHPAAADFLYMETQETSARYQLLAHNVRDKILFIRRRDGLIVKANDAAAQGYGYRCDDLVGRSAAELWDPAVAHDFAKTMEATDERPLFIETRHRRMDGTTFPVEVSAQSAVLGGESIVLAVTRDISHRQEATKDRDRFFDALGREVLMCIASFDGYFLSLNPAWHTTLGYAQEELQKKPFMDYVHPDDREGTIAAMASLSEGEGLSGFENRYQ
ncbi:MAG: PAS domain S-box protein [Candidatus Eremiobacteraeota bacterium]|nr:PAS domain S-box protein [Candidatus Eremiobacteraeota bacterium]